MISPLRLFCIACLSALISFSAGSEILAQVGVVIPYEIEETEAPSTALRSVYGRVVYAVEPTQGGRYPESIENSLRALVKRQVSKAFGDEEGNYVLTLNILSGEELVATRAILSFAWKSKNFLFFNTESSLTGNLDRGGVLTDNFPVAQNNNLLRVKLRLQRAENGLIDTSTFNQISEQVALLDFDVVQEALGLWPGVEVALKVMEKLLSSSADIDLSTSTPMRFIARGTDAPTWITFKLRGVVSKTGKPFINGIDVSVKFEVEESLFDSFDPITDTFSNQSLITALEYARVGSSNVSMEFVDGLGAKRYELLRSYLAALERSTFPDDAKAITVCRTLFETIFSFFSSRDAPLIYAAYLRRYDSILNETDRGFEDCLDRYSQEMTDLGIETESIKIKE